MNTSVTLSPGNVVAHVVFNEPLFIESGDRLETKIDYGSSRVFVTIKKFDGTTIYVPPQSAPNLPKRPFFSAASSASHTENAARHEQILMGLCRRKRWAGARAAGRVPGCRDYDPTFAATKETLLFVDGEEVRGTVLHFDLFEGWAEVQVAPVGVPTLYRGAIDLQILK